MQIENCKLKIANYRWLTTQGVGHVSNGVSDSRIRASSIHRRRLPAKRICNLRFSIFNFQCFVLTTLAILCFASEATAQVIPDKMVVSVTNGSQATPDIITY